MEEADGRVAINYDWQVEVEAPVLRRLAPLLRPAYAANHRWAMARGDRPWGGARCGFGAKCFGHKRAERPLM